MPSSLSLSHPLRRAFVSQQQQQVKVCASAECRLPMERKTRKNSISKCVDACPYVGFLCLGANCTTPLVTFCLASVPPILCAEREETGQFAGRCVFDHFRKRNASSRSACRSPKQIYNKIKKSVRTRSLLPYTIVQHLSKCSGIFYIL